MRLRLGQRWWLKLGLGLRLRFWLRQRLGLRVGGCLRFRVLLLLHEDLVVQNPQLGRVQFGFSPHRWRFPVERHVGVFITLTAGRVTLLLILRQSEVDAPRPGAGVFGFRSSL